MIEKAKSILDFMKIVEEFCLVERDNKMTSGRMETDADHVVKLSYWVMMVAPYLKEKTDYFRMLEIALVHDLVEARSGDFSLSAQNGGGDLKEIKKKREKEAIDYYRSILPEPLNQKIYDLFEEYEQKQTREAKLVWALDKIDALIQANRYKDGDIRYWADCDNGDWYYQYALAKKPLIEELSEEIVLELENLGIEMTRKNMEKYGIKKCS